MIELLNLIDWQIFFLSSTAIERIVSLVDITNARIIQNRIKSCRWIKWQAIDRRVLDCPISPGKDQFRGKEIIWHQPRDFKSENCWVLDGRYDLACIVMARSLLLPPIEILIYITPILDLLHFNSRLRNSNLMVNDIWVWYLIWYC